MTLRLIVCVHNRLALTRRLFECLAAQSFKDFVVYLVDDGSTDGTTESLRKEFGNRLRVEFLSGDGNLWWGGASELGMRKALKEAADDDVIALVNNDVSFEPDFLQRAAAIMKRKPTAVLHPLVIREGQPPVLAKSGAVQVSWAFSLVARPYEGMPVSQKSSFPEFTPVDGLRAQCMLVPVAVARQIGVVNGTDLPHYHSDYEYAYRAKRHGFEVAIARDIQLLHCEESTGYDEFTSKEGFRQFLASFFSIRSVNSFKYKFTFARLCCPKVLVPMFMVTDTVRVVARGLCGMYFPNFASRFRKMVNDALHRAPKPQPK